MILATSAGSAGSFWSLHTDLKAMVATTCVKVDYFDQNGYNFDTRAWDKTARPSIRTIKIARSLNIKRLNENVRLLHVRNVF